MNKNNMLKMRIISVIMAISLVVPILPLSAFADDGENAVAELTMTGDNGATLKKQFGSVDDAISYMETTADVPVQSERVRSFDLKLQAGQSVTPKNGSFTLTNIPSQVVFDLNGGTVNGGIADKSDDHDRTVCNGTVSNSSGNAIEFGGKSTKTLENITAESSDYGIVADGSGALCIKSGVYGRFKAVSSTKYSLCGGTFGAIEITDYTGSEGETVSLSYADLLQTGYIYTNPITDEYISAADMTGTTPVKVAKCGSHEFGSDGKCTKCGFSCGHEEYQDGKCTVCGSKCPHTAVSENSDGKWLCGKCGLEIVAKAELSDDTSYYSDLKSAFYYAPNDSTVTIIAKSRQLSVPLNTSIKQNTTITLDLNGHTLSGYVLKVNQYNSKLTVIDSSNGNGAVGLSVSNGGTLIFAPNNVNTTILQFQIYGGNIELKGGHIEAGKPELYNNVKFADMIPDGYALHYYRGGGAFGNWVKYTDLQNNNVSNLYAIAVQECEHADIDSDRKCLYCNRGGMVATVKTADGKLRGYTDFKAAFNAASDNSACTLTMLTECADDVNVKENAKFTIVSTGQKISGNILFGKDSNITIVGGELQKLSGFSLKSTLKLSGITGSQSIKVSDEHTLYIENNCSLTGELDVQSGGTLYFESGSIKKLKIYDGAKASLSGGTFESIETNDTALSEKMLKDYLPKDRAFADSNGKIVDGRTRSLSNVTVIKHADHTHAWDTTAHELVCDCGDVAETDNDAPIIADIENDKTYYGNTTFKATDKNLRTVTVDGETVALTADGKYTIAADNKEHTVIATDLAGNAATVTTGAIYKIYTVTPPIGTGYTANAAETACHGLPYTFTVTIKNGYTATNSYAVKVNGDTVDGTLTDNTYTYTVEGSKVTDNLIITVDGVDDITAPTAEIKIGENKFASFMNTITFGLFFKNTQTVTVTASDSAGGMVKVEYCLNNKAYANAATAAQMITDWTQATYEDGKAEFSINPDSIGSVYVRVTDERGNYTVINSNGIVMYTDSIADTKDITFTRLSDDDASFNVKLNGNTVKSLSLKGNVIDADNYTVEGGKITLKNKYLKTLAAGKYTITVNYNPMGIAFSEGNGNEAPASTAVMLTVQKKTRTLKYKIDGKIFNGTPCSLIFDESTPKPENAVIEYKVQGEDDSTYSISMPYSAKSYCVRIHVPEDENYARYDSPETKFTIEKREVKIIGLAVENKVYDGNTSAVIITENSHLENTLTDERDLSIDTSNAKAVFSDKNVGMGKTVTFTGFALRGPFKDSYVLKTQPAAVTADITPKELTVGNLKVADKQFDRTKTAKIVGKPVLVGLVEGDNLSLIPGTPSFTDENIGENIPVTFTDFTLDGTDETVGNYKLTQPSGITANIVKYIADGSEYSVNSNDWINTDFVVTAHEGYKLSLTDTENDGWTDKLTRADETADGTLTFYVKKLAENAISTAVTVNYKIDKTAPTGTVAWGEDGTLQKLFNKDVTVTLTAADDASGVKSVQHYTSDKELNSEELNKVNGWTEGNKFVIAAEDAKTFIVYARIEDKAGNVAYVNSDRAEFDTSAPKISGVENGKTYYETKEVSITDKNLDYVTLNGKSAESTLTLIGNVTATYEIRAVDKVGNETVCVVYMKPAASATDNTSGSNPSEYPSENPSGNPSSTPSGNPSSTPSGTSGGTPSGTSGGNPNITTNGNPNGTSSGNPSETSNSGTNAVKSGETGTAAAADYHNADANEADSPDTGNENSLVMWIALLFISGGVMTVSAVAGKKKKYFKH